MTLWTLVQVRATAAGAGGRPGARSDGPPSPGARESRRNAPLRARRRPC